MAKTKVPEVAAEPATPVPFQRPRIEVLERRLQSPHGVEQPRIDLKEVGWDTRWFNSRLASNRIWEAKEKGWTGVLPSELDNPEQIGGFTVSPDGYVVRGEKGEELLMKYPSDWRLRLMKAKAQRNIDALKHQKADAATAAGRALGDQAGEFLSRTQVVGDVTSNVERIRRDAEPDE